jgi:hypothetical protein
MSAAATAAGYLYASGRLRGRNSREEEGRAPEQNEKPRRKEIRVAVMETETPEPAVKSPAKPMPKIQYRTRRWKPE